MICLSAIARRLAIISSCASLFLLLVGHSALASQPTHRYSFTSDASDSIGTAPGTLLGSAIITNGSLVLNGTNGCVQLPANLFTNSKSLTLETWFINNQHLAPRHLWSFSGTPQVTFLVRGSIGFPSSEFRTRGYYGNQSANSMVDAVQISLGKFHHLVWTQDEQSRTARIYLNGLLYAQNTNFTATPGATTTASYLGAGSISSPIKGSIMEFRIYSNALSHFEVLQSKALGADAMPATGTTIVRLHLRMPSHIGQNSIMRPPVFTDLTDQAEVDITSLPEIVFTSSNTNVVNPNPNGYVYAVGLGLADLIATYGGFSATTTVTVVSSDQFALAHRYDFNGISGISSLPDLAASASGTVFNGGAFTNGAQLFLDGVNDHVALPDDLLSGFNELTMEAWVTGFSLNGKWWPRVFDFGGGGGRYLFLAPAVQTDNLGTNTQIIRFAASTNGIIAESPRLTARPWMVDGFETHLAVTYSPDRNSSKLYVNGQLADVGSAPYPLPLLLSTNNWLGRSQYVGDAYFHGLFNEFRLYRTALEASAIAASFALGPDVIGADYVLHAALTGDALTLSWGATASWCVLETSADLSAQATWTSAGATTVFINGRLVVSVALADEARYYRLSPP